MKVINVCAWQGDIDFNKVKESGIAGVIIRAGFGKNNIDEKFEKYITDANAVGLPVGIYWLSYAYTVEMAKSEAEYCLEAIKPYKISMPVYFDFEYDSMNFAKKQGVYLNKTIVTNMYKAFCSTIANAGYKAGYYTNPDYLARYLNDTTGFSNYSKWLALYADSASEYKYDLWQYAAVKTIPGIDCNVDINELSNESIISDPIVGTELKNTAKPLIVHSARAKKNKLIPGDYVKINSNDAVYYDTNSIIPSDIIENTWVISMVSGSKVVLDKSADGTQSIIAAVDKKYLTKVSKE
jgi:GH25 family lysozyme M1 (1,4-beta-N-acetylmuramidase)